MDPNTCLSLIDDCLETEDIEEAEEHVENLRQWLSSGGFEPNWNNYPHARDFYDSVVNV